MMAYSVSDGELRVYGTTRDTLDALRDPSATISSHAMLERLRRQENRIKGQLSRMSADANTNNDSKLKRRIFCI